MTNTKTKTTGTGDGINKRWVVVRRSTGSVVRKFKTRDDARGYKRWTTGFRIYDTVTQQYVR